MDKYGNDRLHARRQILRGALAASPLFLPVPYAWVWAQSDGAMRLVKLPKIALVVGNSAYQNVPALKNPANDAKAIGETLSTMGFDVTLKLDARHADMIDSIQAYAQRLHSGRGEDASDQPDKYAIE